MARPASGTSHTVIQRAPVTPTIRQLPPPQPSAPAAIRGEQLTKQQFNALPDSAVIDFRGTRITAGEARAKLKQAETEAQARAQGAAAQAQAKFEAYRAKFLQEQKAKLDAANAKVRAEIARLRQASAAAPLTQQQAIQREVVELLNRSKTATPAEQVQIEQRAGQLQQQYQQLQQPKSLQQAPRLQQLPR